MNPVLVLKCKGSYDSFKFEDRQVRVSAEFELELVFIKRYFFRHLKFYIVYILLQVQLDSGGSPVKVGRSQGALKPRPDNAIFECRVLSRSHAQVWCEGDAYFIKVL